MGLFILAAVLRHELLWENGGKGLQGLKKSFTQPSILLIDRLAKVWPLYPVVSDLMDQARRNGPQGENDKESKST